jgi:hypothetical protein
MFLRTHSNVRETLAPQAIAQPQHHVHSQLQEERQVRKHRACHSCQQVPVNRPGRARVCEHKQTKEENKEESTSFGLPQEPRNLHVTQGGQVRNRQRRDPIVCENAAAKQVHQVSKHSPVLSLSFSSLFPISIYSLSLSQIYSLSLSSLFLLSILSLFPLSIFSLISFLPAELPAVTRSEFVTYMPWSDGRP